MCKFSPGMAHVCMCLYVHLVAHGSLLYYRATTVKHIPYVQRTTKLHDDLRIGNTILIVCLKLVSSVLESLSYNHTQAGHMP